MSNLAFSQVVNFDKLAEQNASYATTIDTEYLPRLKESCVKVLEPVKAQFKFYVDLQGMNTIEGNLETEVSFICQRCGKEYTQTLKASFLSTCDEEKAKSLQIEDKVDVVELNEDGTFNLLSFLEDCLLLEIPFITTHEEGSKECQEVDNLEFGKIEKSNEDNPFSQLAALKEQLKQNK